jgi:uncharacterized membrane protein YdfJ with MMPL/SSD domain
VKVATEPGIVTPRPDPTALTTQQLLREVDRLQGLIDKVPDIVRHEVARLQELHGEKFNSIATQFSERDKRALALYEANAAAIAKSEASFTKQIDQITTLISASVKNADDKIDDIKDTIRAIVTRIAAIEGASSGAGKAQERTSVIMNLVIAGAVGFVVFMSGVVGVVVFVMTKAH